MSNVAKTQPCIIGLPQVASTIHDTNELSLWESEWFDQTFMQIMKDMSWLEGGSTSKGRK